MKTINLLFLAFIACMGTSSLHSMEAEKRFDTSDAITKLQRIPQFQNLSQEKCTMIKRLYTYMNIVGSQFENNDLFTQAVLMHPSCSNNNTMQHILDAKNKFTALSDEHAKLNRSYTDLCLDHQQLAEDYSHLSTVQKKQKELYDKLKISYEKEKDEHRELAKHYNGAKSALYLIQHRDSIKKHTLSDRHEQDKLIKKES